MQDFHCEICDKNINIKSKSKHLKSKTHIEIRKCDHIILSSKDMDIDEIDEDYTLYMIEHNKYDYCKVKCQFKLVFEGEQHTE